VQLGSCIAAKDHPRDPQELQGTPRGAPEDPRESQRDHKEPAGIPQDPPKELQESLKMTPGPTRGTKEP